MSTHRSNSFTSASLAVLATMLLGGQAFAQYSAAVLGDNPDHYWRFNEATGDTAANIGSEGIEGEYVGGQRLAAPEFTLVDGRKVTGLGADNLAFRVGEDIDEYMTVFDPIMTDLQQFTMTAWVNPGPRATGRIGLFGQNDAIEFGFISANQIQLWTPGGGALNYVIDPATEIPEDTWFHLGAVGRGTGLELYINGQQVANTDQSGTYGRSAFPFNIGGGGIYDDAVTSLGNQFTGTLDDVAIWTTALTDEQIQAHVAAARAIDGNYAQSVLDDSPVGFWDLNEAAGTTATNRGTGGGVLNGTYDGGTQGAPEAASESLPGFDNDTAGFSVESPDPGFVSIDGNLFNGLKEFTFSGWVKPGFIADNRVGLWGKNDALEFGFIDPTTLQMWTPGGGAINLDILDAVFEDEWVHIAAVGDGEELRIYVNGEALAFGGTSIGTPPTPIASYGSSDFPFNVGGGGIYDVSGNQFDGSIDEVAVWTTALTPAQIAAQFQAGLGGVGVPGDFDGDGELTATDIDLLSAEVRAGTNEASFDLNSDGLVDQADRTVWVKDLKITYFGDADLNGEFNSSDFVAVFTTGKYENGEAAGWDEGDWDGNMFFQSGDFVTAFTDGGYELGPRAAVQAVPEPAAGALAAFGVVLLLVNRRRLA